jgi:hypothetical protein
MKEIGWIRSESLSSTAFTNIAFTVFFWMHTHARTHVEKPERGYEVENQRYITARYEWRKRVK